MAFQSAERLFDCLRGLGATRIVLKFLAENDNTKQQIYLGGSLDAVRLLPAQDVRTETLGKRPNFKASLNLLWVGEDGVAEPAPGAKLILYPDYPEVRLSGFLRGCSRAPALYMQPVPPGRRRHNNGRDGRVLCFGITNDRQILAHLAPADSTLARSLLALEDAGSLNAEGVLWTRSLTSGVRSRDRLLETLRAIRDGNPHTSMRLNKRGQPISYRARNGGGYTLEALFGIVPNGCSEPDFDGWELKAYGSNRITLMTPEPDSGYYGQHGVEAFVRRYGAPAKSNPETLYVTGIHRVGVCCKSTGLTLTVRGYDGVSDRITDVSGGIDLLDRSGMSAAGWSFGRMLEHWSRKHASAAYIPYTSNKAVPPLYSYSSPILLGEGTRLERYLNAVNGGYVMYDPGPKIAHATTAHPKVKARSQFRIGKRDLARLYARLEAVDL